MKNWHRGEKTWEVGFFSAYPLLMFIGIISAFLTVAYFWRRQKYSWEILQMLLIIIVPSSIFGARLWYLISEGGWSQWYVLQGLSIQGGVMMATLSAMTFLYFRRNVVDIRTAVGIILPTVLIGQVIGRWGNFNNHEVYGAVVSNKDDLNWLGSWIKGHMYIDGYYRQPFFLYESTLNLFAYIMIVWVFLRKNWLKPGGTAGLYLVWYGVIRLIMEPLRDHGDIMKWGNLQISTAVAVLWILAGIVVLIFTEALTNPNKFVQKNVPNIFLSKKSYTAIMPIKERKVFWIGQLSSKKKKYLFFGEELDNKIKIWLPIEPKQLTKNEIRREQKR